MNFQTKFATFGEKLPKIDCNSMQAFEHYKLSELTENRLNIITHFSINISHTRYYWRITLKFFVGSVPCNAVWESQVFHTSLCIPPGILQQEC